LKFKQKDSKVKKGFSNKNPFTCFTPQTNKGIQSINNHYSKWNMNSFLNSDAQESQIIQEENYNEGGKNEIENELNFLFEKNNW